MYKQMQKRILLPLILIFSFSQLTKAQIQFNDFFQKKSLRIDFALAGSNDAQHCYLEQLLKEPYWGGRQNNLDESMNLGDYCIEIRDGQSKKLIYTDGFSTLFDEWRTTKEAKTIKRSFTNAIQIPFPKQPIDLSIIYRDKGLFTDTLLSFTLDPESQIISQAVLPKGEVKQLLNNGESSQCVDLVILAEGYAQDEQDLFFKEAKKLAEGLFTSAPFKRNKDKFNIYAVGIVSPGSGVDNPHENIWVETPLNATFNTFYSDRYLTSSDVRSIRNYASLVPYDQIYVLVNTDKYGGGGIFNFYSMCSSRGRSENEVFIHEFGHAFAGLGDEYYTSSTAYEAFFDTSVEPWQPNLTTLVNFDLKWKDLLAEKVPIPTPPSSKYKKQTGVFEGGGYMEKGIYRPAYNCRMKTNEAKDFCEVCGLAIDKTVQFLTE